MFCLRKILCGLVIFFYVTAMITYVRCADVDIPDYVDVTETHLPILDSIGQKIRANLEKIRYWQGNAVLYRKGTENGKEKWSQEVSVEFFSDYVHNNRMTITHDKKVVLQGMEQPLSITGILLFNDLYYNYMAYDPTGLIPVGSDSSTTVFRKWEDIPSHLKSKSSLQGHLTIHPRSIYSFSLMDFQFNFNPKTVVTSCSDDDAMPSSADALAYSIRQKMPFKIPVHIKKVGDIVDLVYIYPGNKKSINIYDLSKAGHLVHRTIDDMDDVTIRTVDFEQHGEIWLPTKVYWKIRQVEEETIVFSDQKINEPIPKTFFVPANLGVKQGDSCYDSRIDKHSIITDNSFPKPEILDISLNRSSYLSIRFFLIVFGSCMMSVGLFLIYLKQKSKNRSM